MIPEYSKILTLFEREEATFKVIEDRLKSPAFELINKWHVEEKIHGQNVRVHWDGYYNVTCCARKADSSGLHKDLLQFLQEKFTVSAFKNQFGEGTPVTLFGEGCGAGIQKGGGNYSETKTFVLFDVLVGTWWLEPDNVYEIAMNIGAFKATVIYHLQTIDEIVEFVRNGFDSYFAKGNTGNAYPAEGIIAKSVPGLFMRDGRRLMFKLKTEDFAKPTDAFCVNGVQIGTWTMGDSYANR